MNVACLFESLCVAANSSGQVNKRDLLSRRKITVGALGHTSRATVKV